MAFWSGEKLAIQLPGLITNFQAGRIDCAAYTLTVGPDIFITEDEPAVGEPRKGVRIILAQDESFRIPPGQFAFLITEETVEVPRDALAFISMKATYKFKGLVNVSGFHVDPGWKGPLVFSVYNAGPAPVPLRRGLPLFLIWYSDLDRTTTMVYPSNPAKTGLRDDLISSMSGQVFSPMTLGGRLSDIKNQQVQLANELRSLKEVLIWVAGVLATFLVAFLVALFTLIGEPLRDFILKEFSEHRTEKTKLPPLERQDQEATTNKEQEGKLQGVVPERTTQEKTKDGKQQDRVPETRSEKERKTSSDVSEEKASTRTKGESYQIEPGQRIPVPSQTKPDQKRQTK